MPKLERVGACEGRKAFLLPCAMVVLAASSVGAGVAAEAETLPRVDVIVARRVATAPDIVIPGDIEARFQNNVSFRVGGKISARFVDVGAQVTPNEVLAEIAPEQQRSDLRNAEASLASAQATLAQNKLTYDRQAELIKQRFTTASSYDGAVQNVREAQAQLDSAKAQVGTMKEKLSYTDLRAGVAGVVTARNAEVGQVVKEGDPIFSIAQDGPRDAVFQIYEALVTHPPADKRIRVRLISDPSVTAEATVREISPIVDSATGAVKVKATLDDAPKAMNLGAGIVGDGHLDAEEAVVLPWSALYRWLNSPAVWIVEPKGRTVEPRRIVITSYIGRDLVLKSGVAPGDRVVTAGIQFLHPGQVVDIASEAKP